jgi:hypothetical protein
MQPITAAELKHHCSKTSGLDLLPIAINNIAFPRQKLAFADEIRSLRSSYSNQTKVRRAKNIDLFSIDYLKRRKDGLKVGTYTIFHIKKTFHHSSVSTLGNRTWERRMSI